MSAPSNCCQSACADVEVISVPGVEGEEGLPGTDGTDGVSAFTLTTAEFDVPAVSATVEITVVTNAWMAVGEVIFIPGAGYFEVVSKSGATAVTILYLDYAVNTETGETISVGALVTPSGVQGPPAAATLPTALTDNSTGTASDTIAAGVGVQMLAFFIDAAMIADGDLLTTYVPGYRFKILKFDARCAAPVTTGAKASNLNLEIGTTNVTGGVIALAGLYAQGAAQAGTAITAANVGTALESFSIEASATTTFIEGSFWLIVSIQNMDGADAFASIADKINDILVALA